MAALKIALLGTFEARLASDAVVSFPRKKAEALLAYLSLRAGQKYRRDTLATLLWGDTSDERARHSLRQALVTLRQALPGAAATSLLEDGDTVGVNASIVDVDVHAFERLANDGTATALEAAVALYRGDLLDGIGVTEPLFEEWLRSERERLRELLLESLAKLLAHHVRGGADDSAIRVAVRLLSLDAAQESVHRTLMRLYARQGRRGAALRQYQACVGALERELGIEPEAETRQLYRDLLQTEAAPSAHEQPEEVARVSASTVALVGRDAELAMLRQRLGEACHGRGAVGLIQGDAGIGKTRLAEALAAEATDSGARVFCGRAYESEQVLALGPWVEAFRAGNVVPRSLEHLPAPFRSELARLFPELGSPPRESATPEDYVRLFEAMARAVEGVARSRPLVILLEDLHWADEMSLRFLVFLGRRVVDWPVLVIGSLRVDELMDAPALRRSIAQLGRQPRFFSTTLAPLSEPETVALVRSLIRAGTEEASLQRFGQTAWRASEGNPFMISEIVRARHEGGGAADGDVVFTPTSVRALIVTRLDRLGERARRVAAVTSVVGRDVDFGIVERVAELGSSDAAEGIEELVGRRILHVVGERLAFTHDRIRETVYDGLLPPYRRRLHEATARALESQHEADSAPHALALGRHYYAGEVWDRACRYLSHAGAIAADRAAHREAVACLEQALDALRRLPSSRDAIERAIDLRFAIRQSCVPLRDHARMLQQLDEAVADAGALDDRLRLAWASVYLTHARFLAGDSARAIDAGRRGLELCRTLSDASVTESANFYLGQVLQWVGDYRAAATLLRDNVSVLEPELRRLGVAAKQAVNSRTFLAWCLAETGEFAEAIAHADEAIALSEAADNAYWLVHGCVGVGLAQLRRGAFDAAANAAERAIELCRGRDFAALWAIPAAILGSAYAHRGRVGEALPLLERAAEIVSVLGSPVLTMLGEAYLIGGRTDGAAAAAARALELATERGERGWQAWAHKLVGDVAANRDDADTAEAAFRRGLDGATALGMRPVAAHCHLGLARLARRAGKRQTAAEHLGAATEAFAVMEMGYWLDVAHHTR